jgi:hypothetical protein
MSAIRSWQHVLSNFLFCRSSRCNREVLGGGSEHQSQFDWPQEFWSLVLALYWRGSILRSHLTRISPRRSISQRNKCFTNACSPTSNLSLLAM